MTFDEPRENDDGCLKGVIVIFAFIVLTNVLSGIFANPISEIDAPQMQGAEQSE